MNTTGTSFIYPYNTMKNNTMKQTPLQVACIGHFDQPVSQRLKMVKFLVDRGADLTALDCYQRSPLHMAAHTGALAIMEFLLDLGLPLNVYNPLPSGYYGKVDEQRGRGETVMHIAVLGCNDDIEPIKWLLERGAEFDTISDFTGKYPHTFHDYKGGKATSLFSYGVITPYRLAVLLKYEKVAKLLSDRGARWEAKSDDIHVLDREY